MGGNRRNASGRRRAFPWWEARRRLFGLGAQATVGAWAALLLLGVVIRFQDLDQAFQRRVSAVALGAEHHNVAV